MEVAAITTTADTAAESPNAPASSGIAPAGPVPMSFPAVLRGPGGVNDRFVHLLAHTEYARGASLAVAPKKNRRDEKEGKRWVRRKENGSCCYSSYNFWGLNDIALCATCSSLCRQPAHH